ncbi:hypothetical protein OCU04_002006 [Sclerotinia nivalis]|uniref:Uncharacterized protein n=1 Tax=Sclerotinia nivalis TaxID=352851 RepID=A0A9X0DQ90_9HELO|nr:hypothetical protein OCU04_002006 [Sclerotinia nivalis]
MLLTDWSGNFFKGKKIAVLRDKKVALVSPQAQVGDIIYALGDDLNDLVTSYYIFRSVDAKSMPTDFDQTLVDFFKANKNETRKRYVEYTHEGRLIWKEKEPPSGCFIPLEIYAHIKRKILKAGLGLPKVCDHNGDFIIHPILKEKLDFFSSNLMVYGLRSIGERDTDKLLLGTDTSKVEHFRYVGECIVDKHSLRFSHTNSSTFTEWYEKDLPANVLSNSDQELDDEDLKRFVIDSWDYLNTPAPPRMSKRFVNWVREQLHVDPSNPPEYKDYLRDYMIQLGIYFRPLPHHIIAIH